MTRQVLILDTVKTARVLFRPQSTTARVSHSPMVTKIGNKMDQWASAAQVRQQFIHILRNGRTGSSIGMSEHTDEFKITLT